MGTANDQRTGCDGVCNERTFQKCVIIILIKVSFLHILPNN